MHPQQNMLHHVQKEGVTIFLPLTLPNTDHFQNSFTNRLISKL